MTPATSLPASVPGYSDFYPIILCTASRRIRSSGETASRTDGESPGIGNEFTYIQGAGDDSEAWACVSSLISAFVRLARVNSTQDVWF